MLAGNSSAMVEALKRCEHEPIQFIGDIQSHGVLLAVDSHSKVQVASSNLGTLLGLAATEALKQPAADVLGKVAWAAVAAMNVPAQQQLPLPITLPIYQGETRLDCQAQVHRADDLLVIEVETPNQSFGSSHQIDFDSTDSLLSALLVDTDSIEAYAAVIAGQVQAATGFDRVMVYQFDYEWNGKVIAENRKDGVTSFLGNHFPASDIPPPARALYTRNLARIMVDRDAPTVALLQSTDLPCGRALDLSFSVLRSMSPIHLEYLKNLGVRASLTVSLLQNGRLWGLIACHHETPRQLPFKLRQSMELVSKTIATRLTAIAFVEGNRYHTLVRDLLPRLAGLTGLAGGTSAESLLPEALQREVLQLVHATGAILVMGDNSTCLGITPMPDQIQALLAWLRPRLVANEVFITHSLAANYPPASAFANVASGLLAISLDNRAERCLLWIREEVVHSTSWAGEASKHLIEDEYGPKLEPRRSFERWVQTKQGESPHWSDPEVDAARALSLTLAERFSRQQLKLAEAYLRIAATAFESLEGMTITDTNGIILRVNKAFTKITGYEPSEVIGLNPRVLHSGRQDIAFYIEMWDCIKRTDSWQGEIWNRRKGGEVYPEWLSITAVKNSDGQVTNYVGTFSDMTDRKNAADRIEHLAFYDHLTRLPNRRLMLDRLGQATVNVARRQCQGAVMMIDLDNFKALNDTMGHAVGDLLLIEAASRLSACIRAGDTVARLGGDEFVVILVDLDQGSLAPMQAEIMGEKILASLAQVYELQVPVDNEKSANLSHFCTSSIGITLFGKHAVSVDELIKRADTAMYQAKAAGRNTLRFFDPEMQASVKARAALEIDLRHAIIENQFLLHYQAQVDITGKVVGAEALVRWQHPKRGLVSPAEFIALAETTGLILPLGDWVLKTACAQLARWAARADMAHLTLAVNVSARQFAQADFVEHVLNTVKLAGARIDRLKLELTESLLLDNADEVIDKMSALKAKGARFSLDDFGTGYSSLSYLKHLPLDQLKIDQSFVRDITTDRNDAAIARTVVTLGQNLDMSIIAEGVETIDQRNVLAGLGCHVYQGYLYSRPVPIDAFETFALAQTPVPAVHTQ